ncbi:hypothetical protein P606_13375 [Comamonas thiooxydans]|nr:hypothetical protein P606_13375 [Comamonas thiooxydans]
MIIVVITMIRLTYIWFDKFKLSLNSTYFGLVS